MYFKFRNTGKREKRENLPPATAYALRAEDFQSFVAILGL